MSEFLEKFGSTETVGSVIVMPSPTSGPTIAAAVSITYRTNPESNYIDEEFAMPSMEGSSVQHAVVDSGEGAPIVAITSLHDGPQMLKIECISKNGPSISRSLRLKGGETRLISTCEKRDAEDAEILGFRNGSSGHPHGPLGIGITSDAMPGSFSAFALAPHGHENETFFSSVPFTDPKMTLSPNSVFVGVPVGQTALLPSGGFVPQLSVANFGKKEAKVTLRYSVSGDKPTFREVASFQIPAMSSKEIRLGDLESDPGLRNSFIAVSDGAPGDLSFKLVAKSDSRLREVELIGKDQNDPYDIGNHPWSLAYGTDAVLLLFNDDKSSRRFTVLISAEESVVWRKTYVLNSMQTEAISIRSLISGQVTDDDEKTLPLDAVSGQITWISKGEVNGKGRLVQANQSQAMARNFSCGGGTSIPCYPATLSFSASPINVGDTTVATFRYSNCSTDVGGCGGSFVTTGCFGQFPINWSGSNIFSITPVLNPSPYGCTANVTGVSAGAGSVTAVTQICGVGAGANETVKPKITGISPAKGLIGSTISVTISGSGLLGATVSAGSGITVTVDSSNANTIQATFAIASNAPSGNHSVTATVAGQTSSAQNFFVQVPTYFGPTGFSNADCVCGTNSAGTCINVHNQVLDQLGQPITASGITPQELVCQNGNCQPTYNNFSTPVTTTASGTFDDVPIGTCFGPPVPSSNICINVTVQYQALANSGTFPITTLVLRKDCVQGENDQVYSNPSGYNQTYIVGNVP